MKQCIFCMKHKEDKEFNREHIILDSLGGKGYEDICDKVCTSCNSSLGTRVDAVFINHPITEYIRFFLKIKGRNGVPNPFKKQKFNYDNTPFLGELITNKKGEIIGFRADHKVYEMNEEIVIVGPRKDFSGYVVNQLKKRGMPILSEEEIAKNTVHFNKIPYIKKIELLVEDKKEYIKLAFPAILKMAYEFCFIKLGEEYLKDYLATDIRKFLMTFDCKKQEFYCCPTGSVWDELDNQDRIIIFSLYTKNNKLYVNVKLFGLIMCSICMSERADKYNLTDKNTLIIEV